MAGLVVMLPPPGGSKNQVCNTNIDSILRRRVIDFAEATAVKGSTLVAGDTIKVFNFSAGELVTNVWTRQLVAGTASSTIDIGDSVGASAWHNDLATDGAAQTLTAGAGANASAGYLYAADNYLLLTLGSTPPLTGKVEFTAKVIDFGTSIVK